MHKKLIVIVAVLMFGMTNTASASVLLQDDFESGLGQWQTFGSPAPSIKTMIGSEGTSTQVFATNDDANWGGFALSNQTFDYADTGLSVRVDVKHANFGGNFQEKSTIFLNQTNQINTSVPSGGYAWFLALELFGNSSAYPSQYRATFMTENSTIESAYINVADGDAWHNIGFDISQDGFVQFFYDDQMLYQSNSRITAAYNGTASLFLGHRRSFHDNVLVTTNSVPAPHLLGLFLMGLIGLFFKKID